MCSAHIPVVRASPIRAPAGSLQHGHMASPLPLHGCTVKIKGLPFKATRADVLSFFSGWSLQAEDVFIQRHLDGRPNGEAFIVFKNPAEARRATQKHRETFGEKFGDRYVRVYPTLESDIPDLQAAALQQATPQQAPPSFSNGHADSVVKIKSLPFEANQLDIIHFFVGFKLKPNGVQLVVRSDNKPTGEAFVDFESFDEAARAIREKDQKIFSDKFGDRYVRLIQVSRKEMHATLALRFGGEGILKMKGIPFKATAADVRKFFMGYKIKLDGISFIMHADARPTGMAFIEFETPQEAVRALDKDRAKFGPEYGDRFCMLQLVGRHEMDKVTLHRESEAAPAKLMTMTALQAAALASATQAALNPALHPLLMASANPWLHLGLMNQHAPSPLTAPPLGPIPHPLAPPGKAVPPLLDTSLAAQLQLGATGPLNPGLNAAGLNGVGLNAGLNGAGLNGAGLNAAGLNGAGLNAAGLNAAGLNAAGLNAAGLNGAGLNGAGLNAAALNGAGLNGGIVSHSARSAMNLLPPTSVPQAVPTLPTEPSLLEGAASWRPPVEAATHPTSLLLYRNMPGLDWTFDNPRAA